MTPQYYSDRPWMKTYPGWFEFNDTCNIQSVLAKFNASAASCPDAPCIYYFDTCYSFLQIEKMATAFSAALAEKNIRKGDRVLFVLQNIPQAVIAALAVWMRGGVVVPVNPMYTGKDLDHLLSDSGAKCIVCEEVLYEKTIHGIAKGRPVITTCPLDLLGSEAPVPNQLKTCEKKSFPQTSDFMAQIRIFEDQAPDIVMPDPEDLAYLVYTSGTTGPPKGAMISHANIHHNCLVYESACRMNKTDVVLGVAPMFHITGIVAHLAVSFHSGIPMVLFNRFTVEDALHLIERHRVTFTVAAITVYIAMLNHPDLKSYDISHFTKAYSGGAPVSPSTVEKFQAEMGLTIHNVYGLTESASPATISPLGKNGPVDEGSGALSVGLVIPGIDAWVVDVENGEKGCAAGRRGRTGPSGSKHCFRILAETRRDGCGNQAPGLSHRGMWPKLMKRAGAIL